MSAACRRSSGRKPAACFRRATPLQLANAMTAAQVDPDDAAALAARLRTQIRQRFTVEAMAATIDGAYRTVVAG